MPTLSFLLGLLVLGYLTTFVVFAVIRFLTGVSIQRVGPAGLRRITFSPRHGIKVHIRGLGLSAHRPTFALPTWLSFFITELVVSVDLQELGASDNDREKVRSRDGNANFHKDDPGAPAPPTQHAGKRHAQGKLWRRLTEVKDKIKRLHSSINWIKLVDLVAVATQVEITGVGSVRIERLTLSVDTRSKTVDRSKLFQHHKTKPDVQRPAEWKAVIRSVLFTPDGGEYTEILDYVTINIHGMLHSKLEGLRDASIALKLGRLTLPLDDIEHSRKCADLLRGRYAQMHKGTSAANQMLVDVVKGVDDTESPEDRIVRNVSDSQAFIASTLRGIQELQFAVGFLGLSQQLNVSKAEGKGVFFHLAMKELGLDVMRLDPKSPAHKMYFSTNDVAHQGMVTAIAISAGIDDGYERPERMLYIPMITATAKTTLLSRTVHYSTQHDASQRNTNILYANFVCTSPSVDLDPKHLPLIREILKKRQMPTATSARISPNRHNLISQLLPKSYIKLSVQEPVIRVSLPPMDKTNAAQDDYDLLISSVSTAAIEIESSHVVEGKIHYNLGTQYRHNKLQLYYQTSAGERHNLLQSDTVEVELDVNGIPDATVIMNGRCQTFTIFLIRPDICEGVRYIVKQLRRDVLARQHREEGPSASFLRRIPEWLQRCRIEGANFALELGGVDEQVSTDTRGLALHLASWGTEYTSNARPEEQRDDSGRRPSLRRAKLLVDPEKDAISQSTSARRKPQSFADGRRLTLRLQNLDGYIVDSTKAPHPESLLSMPHFGIDFATSTEANGPVFHAGVHAGSVLLRYSLYNHFAIGVAFMVARSIFLSHDQGSAQPRKSSTKLKYPLQVPNNLKSLDEIAHHEITTFDFKTTMVQLKAKFPSDPPMMMQVFDVHAGRQRYGAPSFRCRLARAYVRVPRVFSAWSRIVSIKGLRLDLRELRRKTGKPHVPEKSIDVVTEAIRFGVPHSLVVHSIFDNVNNVIKTSKQLRHHFATGTNDYVLMKQPEAPKQVPRITFRTQLLLFDIEDSPFEWKLNAIYRTGLLEQKQRLAREDAFKVKEERLARRARRGFRAHSAHADDRSRPRDVARDGSSVRRSQSSPRKSSAWSSQSSQRQPRRRTRYDADGQCCITDQAKVSVDTARQRLHHLNAKSWKTRIDQVLDFQNNAIREAQSLFWGLDELPEGAEQQERILALGMRPALLVAALSDLTVTIEKPSFPMEDLPKFMHDVGKGMPHDMKYGMLVPMNIHVAAGEVRVQLRDYPLPLWHVPPLARGQSPRLQSLSVRTDFVIAEEFRDIESQRHVTVEVIPREKMSSGEPFAIDVRRTISPVKTYSDMKFEINTSNPTKITWGTSYQPAIQDTMQIIENFTKPPVDISERIGFWDKIRLNFHSRVNVAWKGDGDVHLVLKGTRDPYVVIGQGAGLAMVWRKDVRWNIAQSDDARKFMTVDSGEYILAVPDFSARARRGRDGISDEDLGAVSGLSEPKGDPKFRKVVMKLSGNVQWIGGLVFERDLSDGTRSFDFKPHYGVVLKQPDYAEASAGQKYDAYHDFRSHHIHMSVAIAAPFDRDWSPTNHRPSENYNSIHLTPKFFSHFFNWWSMFSGVMALPIRQGPLWGATQKKSKKFGRHVATFKYNVLLSPLYVSHVYKHQDIEDQNQNVGLATGLKMRLDSFMLDLHQRREYFDIGGPLDVEPKVSSGLRINEGQLDFVHADLRALSASIPQISTDDIHNANDSQLASFATRNEQVDVSKFEIPDNDLTWIDMDDFVELDSTLPTQSDPITKILPLGYAPRFTYLRQTDHGGIIAGDVTRTSPFGDEPTHHCVMSVKNDPRRVQVELIQKRLNKLREQRAHNERAVGEQELSVIRNSVGDTSTTESMKKSLEALREHSENLQRKYEFLQSMLETLSQRIEHDDPSTVPGLETSEAFYEAHENADRPMEDPLSESVPLADYTNDFNNRFIVHNAQVKWNNSLRNIILRYFHQNTQRRGFVYYMSQRAVKFILDVIEERGRKGSVFTPTHGLADPERAGLSPDGLLDDESVQERIDELLRDGREFVNADDPTAHQGQNSSENGGPRDDTALEYTPLNTYQFRLIAPQLQLQSENNPKAAVLVTTRGMQLKVVQIIDQDRVSDDVSGLILRRFTAVADSMQMFVTNTKSFATEHLHMYSANRYGVKTGTYWPPWAPMEIMYEYHSHPFGFNRVVHRTSASLRCDKYNALRLKYNDRVGDANSTTGQEDTESRMDHIWVEFPQFRAICDSAQYYALYTIVMDLILYSEPLEKTRSERLEKIMLASDFSDLSGAPEMVHMLQERIRQLEEIRTHFHVNEMYLDRQGWIDRLAMDQDLASCEDELFFMMKAITTAQQRVEDRRDQESVSGLQHLNLSAKEIAWHLIRDKGESLVEFQLKSASFDRTDNNDGSNYNCMEISRINGFNLLPNALYPEMIAPFVDESRGYPESRQGQMLRVNWLMLEAIAGIPVVDYFEIDLVPVKLQVERDIAKKLFEYIFPGIGGNAFEGGGFSPFMVKHMLPTQEDDDDDDEPFTNSTTGVAMPTISEPESEPSHASGTGTTSLEQRLKPTLNLPQRTSRGESKGLGISTPSLHQNFSFFGHSNKSRQAMGFRSSPSKKNNIPGTSRTASQQSVATTTGPSGTGDADRAKRFTRHRDATEAKKQTTQQSDDLTQMVNRANNYMTLSFVKIPSMVLCLSYKGQGKRNIEDVHNLVFRMPTLEYRNKTWSNLDLALQLKKDLIRALVSHAGAIVGNKLIHHKPRKLQSSSLRDIAHMSTFLSPSSARAQASDSSLPDIHSTRTPASRGRPWTESDSRPSGLHRRRSVDSWPSFISAAESTWRRGESQNGSGGSDGGSGGGSGNGNGSGNGSGSSSGPVRPEHHTPRRRSSLSTPPVSRVGDNEVSVLRCDFSSLSLSRTDTLQPSSSRPRATSISRHISGFGERLRGGEDGEDSGRKSKLLLGGQKLLRTLRD